MNEITYITHKQLDELDEKHGSTKEREAIRNGFTVEMYNKLFKLSPFSDASKAK